MRTAVTLLSLLFALGIPALAGAAKAKSPVKPAPAAAPAPAPVPPALPPEPEPTPPPAPVAVAEPEPVPPPAAEKPAPAPEEPAPAFELKPYGFLRLKYAYVQPDPSVAFVGHNDGFMLQNARAGVAARYGTRLSVNFSLEAAVDDRDAPNEVVGSLKFGVKDAFADFVVVGPAQLRAGHFSPTFELEGTTPETGRVFVDRSLEYRGVRATEGYQVGGIAPMRSLGVAVRSDKAFALGPVHLGYEILVANAADEGASANQSDSPAYSLSLFPTVPGWGRLILATRYEERRTGDLPFEQTETRITSAAGLEVTVSRVRAAGQVLYRESTFPTTGGPAENGLGAHAEASVRVLESAAIVELGYRWALLHASDLVASDVVQEHTAGLNLQLRDWPLRFQLNYTHPIEESGRALTNDRVETVFQVSL